MPLERNLVKKYGCSWKDAHEVVLGLKKERGMAEKKRLTQEEEDRLMGPASEKWERLYPTGRSAHMVSPSSAASSGSSITSATQEETIGSFHSPANSPYKRGEIAERVDPSLIEDGLEFEV